ncbi:ras-related protein Rab-15-like isoform X2 [Boleophthalmus pectinirostris]|uniref:ras-related protein Rab-15-like isoform X2 n=1 Tax=Boleophthalmus pectinirostris TaxID=150288 RepID=UPI00242B0761|nr:ras-related protein Rab-15-like isoform X2 [Boleophthalmus pectinirostris]
MAKQYDILFRLLMLGDSGVGKTSMLRRFTESEFESSHISTIGVDFKMKTLEIDGLKVRVQIWDTAGQERYKTITKQYYRRAQFAPQQVQSILVGNKSDEQPNRQVPVELGIKLASSYGMDFFETSAFANCNINESFTRVTELVLQAHKSDIDNLIGSLDEYLERAALGEESSSSPADSGSQRTCAC